jgi:hypothetical protein
MPSFGNVVIESAQGLTATRKLTAHFFGDSENVHYLRHVAARNRTVMIAFSPKQIEEAYDYTATRDRWQCVQPGFESSVGRPLEKYC